MMFMCRKQSVVCACVCLRKGDSRRGIDRDKQHVKFLVYVCAHTLLNLELAPTYLLADSKLINA